MGRLLEVAAYLRGGANSRIYNNYDKTYLETWFACPEPYGDLLHNKPVHDSTTVFKIVLKV